MIITEWSIRIQYVLGLWCLTPLSTIFSAILWRSVLLVQETGVPGENKTTYLPEVTDKLDHINPTTMRPPRPLVPIWNITDVKIVLHLKRAILMQNSLSIKYKRTQQRSILVPMLTPYLWRVLPVHTNRIGGEMVSVLSSSAVDHVFELWSARPKNGICSYSNKHAALMRNSKGWFARYQDDNMCQWGDMFIHWLLFQ